MSVLTTVMAPYSAEESNSEDFKHDRELHEVALLLDIPKGTVKSRLHHAIARLNALVRGEDAA